MAQRAVDPELRVRLAKVWVRAAMKADREAPTPRTALAVNRAVLNLRRWRERAQAARRRRKQAAA